MSMIKRKYFPADPRVEVEFFEPKIRSDLEQRDAEIVKNTGKGPANGDEWTWLTPYCRIPVRFMTVIFLREMFVNDLTIS